MELFLSQGTVSHRRAYSSKTVVLWGIFASSAVRARFWSVADEGERLSDGTVSVVPEGSLKVPVLSESPVSSGVAGARGGGALEWELRVRGIAARLETQVGSYVRRRLVISR